MIVKEKKYNDKVEEEEEEEEGQLEIDGSWRNGNER